MYIGGHVVLRRPAFVVSDNYSQKRCGMLCSLSLYIYIYIYIYIYMCVCVYIYCYIYGPRVHAHAHYHCGHTLEIGGVLAYPLSSSSGFLSRGGFAICYIYIYTHTYIYIYMWSGLVWSGLILTRITQ